MSSSLEHTSQWLVDNHEVETVSLWHTLLNVVFFHDFMTGIHISIICSEKPVKDPHFGRSSDESPRAWPKLCQLVLHSRLSEVNTLGSLVTALIGVRTSPSWGAEE